MAKRRPTGRPIAVKFTDPATSKSLSFTVYTTHGIKSLWKIAYYAQQRLRFQYKTTNLTDSRHKRRSF